MADITKITVNGTNYNLKDSGALRSVPAASSSSYGGIKTGYSSSGNNRAVLLDANGKAYVQVPSVSLPINCYDDTVLNSYGASTSESVRIEGAEIDFYDSGSCVWLNYDRLKALQDHEVLYKTTTATTSSPYTCPAMNTGQIFIIKCSNTSWKLKLPSGGFYIARELQRYDEGDYGSGGSTLTFGSAYVFLVRVY
ncbi:MAG: hypothetical protein J5800_06285 [Spirochaetales bacterium]|nr:hypothetical protein [Spirochaetales bacterium]